MKTNYDVIIIGGGASGMMASIFSARNGNSTLVLDHNEKLGKKLYITGKGKCNLTNNSPIETHLNNIITNSKFMFSALNQFSPKDTMEFFEENGLKVDYKELNNYSRVIISNSYNENKCVKLNWDANKLRIDEISKNISSYQYDSNNNINEIIFNINKKDSISYVFYKTDFTKTYDYQEFSLLEASDC